MLDPQRIGLNAASVGFLARTGQKVDWASFKQALQTDDSRVCEVSAEMQTPVDELHVMGGQRFGFEGNSNLKMNARQERQMNGYPLRSFSAEAPSIILPDKYGGLPLYTRNQTEYKDFVSSYTAPLSMVLQNDTVLLGKQGYSVTNESASQPFKDVGFEHNLHKSKTAIDYNEAVMQQRKWLQIQSRAAQKQKFGEEVAKRRAMGKKETGAFIIPASHETRGMGDGIFISANGAPVTTVQDEAQGDRFNDATMERHQFVPAPPRNLSSESNLPELSSDNFEDLSSRRSSNIMADEILHQRREKGTHLLGRILERRKAGSSEGFEAFRRNEMFRRHAALREETESLNMWAHDEPAPESTVEGRVARGILSAARGDQVRFGNVAANEGLADVVNPLHRQLINSDPLVTPNGSQGRSLSEAGSIELRRFARSVEKELLATSAKRKKGRHEPSSASPAVTRARNQPVMRLDPGNLQGQSYGEYANISTPRKGYSRRAYK